MSSSCLRARIWPYRQSATPSGVHGQSPKGAGQQDWPAGGASCTIEKRPLAHICLA